MSVSRFGDGFVFQLGRFGPDRRGMSSVEFALVAMVFFLFIFGIFDFGRALWQWNAAAKATHWGARYAVVNDIVATGLANYDGLVAAGGNGLSVPVGAIVPNPVICDVNGCNGYGPLDVAAFNGIVASMQQIYDRIQPENVVVEYEHIGFGFAGNPYGPDITPMVRIRLQGMVFNLVTPGLSGLVTITMPEFLTSLAGEDLPPVERGKMTAKEETRLVAVMRSAEIGADVISFCENVDGTRVDMRVSTVEEFASQDVHLNGNDVLLLDLDSAQLRDEPSIRSILSDRSSAGPVLVTAPDVSLDDIRALMQLGVIDVLPQPIRQADLVIALDHASRLRPQKQKPASPNKGKVISFLQGGGGVGATVLATQGACILAREAAKDGAKVCLLDFDIQFGTAGLYLDLNSSVGFVDLIENTDDLDVSFLRGAMTTHDCGLDVLTCPGSVIPLDVITPEFMTNCIDLARQAYDYVVVDLTALWTSWSYAVLCASDLILLVSELTVGGIGQTIRQLETLREQDVSRPIVRLVLNKFQRGWGMFGKSADVRDAEKALGRKFDQFISRDFDLINEVIDQGALLDQIEGSARIYKEITALMSDSRNLLDSISPTSAEGSEAAVAKTRE
jgi:pilus assembly protein CpaE